MLYSALLHSTAVQVFKFMPIIARGKFVLHVALQIRFKFRAAAMLCVASVRTDHFSKDAFGN